MPDGSMPTIRPRLRGPVDLRERALAMTHRCVMGLPARVDLRNTPVEADAAHAEHVEEEKSVMEKKLGETASPESTKAAGGPAAAPVSAADRGS